MDCTPLYIQKRSWKKGLVSFFLMGQIGDLHDSLILAKTKYNQEKERIAVTFSNHFL